MAFSLKDLQELLGKIAGLFTGRTALNLDLIVRDGHVVTLKYDIPDERPRRKIPVRQAGSSRKSGSVDSSVTPDQVLDLLRPEKMRLGLNLRTLARKLGVVRKTAIKPVLDALISSGELEEQRTKFRLPGRVTRGRKLDEKTEKPAPARRNSRKGARKSAPGAGKAPAKQTRPRKTQRPATSRPMKRSPRKAPKKILAPAPQSPAPSAESPAQE